MEGVPASLTAPETVSRTPSVLVRGAALVCVLLLGACAPASHVVRPPETDRIARIDSVLATDPPLAEVDSLTAERARLAQSREERLSIAALVAAAIAVIPVVIYVVLRDLEE